MTTFHELVEYSGIGMENLPEGLEKVYSMYKPTKKKQLLRDTFINNIIERFQIPAEKALVLSNAVQAIEADEKLARLTRFLVDDMCASRNRCEMDDYKAVTPTCLKEFNEFYSLILLLACVEPGMEILRRRGVPEHYFSDIPYRPMKGQINKFVETGDPVIADFPWDMNFYTCSIFLFDRFYFIPYRFGDRFTMYRNKRTGKAVALKHAGEVFRRDGQLNGINGVFDNNGSFETKWDEDEKQITAYPINPMGFVEGKTMTIDKGEWEVALSEGDLLLGWHIPAGPGYTPERLKYSMELALNFYSRYFPELAIKGFWSESWLYDARLSLILPQDSNIVSMQRQFYNYPINEGDGMLRYEVFGDWKAEPEKVELKSSLQRKAAAYMAKGGRFNTPSMVLMKEEVALIGQSPYITVDDVEKFNKVVDSHLQ